MTETTFAAAVYARDLQQRDALARFAAELGQQGVRVGGLVQDVSRGENGRMTRIDMVELDTGRRIAINRPTRENIENKTCSLNTNALAESTEALRRAVRDGVDVIVLEKFGEQEQKGQGLSDEIFAAIAEDIPLLIAVPEFALDLWRERTGEMGETLAYDLDAFRQWWAGVR
jgi:nucleoside-triphosphatase THEP1